MSRRDSNEDMSKKTTMPVATNGQMGDEKKLATQKILTNKISSKDRISLKSGEILNNSLQKSLSTSPKIKETEYKLAQFKQEMQ